MHCNNKHEKQIEMTVIASSNCLGHINDPYFNERKVSLTNTMKSIENGSMKTVDFNSSIDKLIAVYSS